MDSAHSKTLSNLNAIMSSSLWTRTYVRVFYRCNTLNIHVLTKIIQAGRRLPIRFNFDCIIQTKTDDRTIRYIVYILTVWQTIRNRAKGIGKQQPYFCESRQIRVKQHDVDLRDVAFESTRRYWRTLSRSAEISQATAVLTARLISLQCGSALWSNTGYHSTPTYLYTVQ